MKKKKITKRGRKKISKNIEWRKINWMRNYARHSVCIRLRAVEYSMSLRRSDSYKRHITNCSGFLVNILFHSRMEYVQARARGALFAPRRWPFAVFMQLFFVFGLFLFWCDGGCCCRRRRRVDWPTQNMHGRQRIDRPLTQKFIWPDNVAKSRCRWSPFSSQCCLHFSYFLATRGESGGNKHTKSENHERGIFRNSLLTTKSFFFFSSVIELSESYHNTPALRSEKCEAR